MKIIDSLLNWCNDIKKKREIDAHLDWIQALSKVYRYSIEHFAEVTQSTATGGITLDHVYKYPITLYSPAIGFKDQDKLIIEIHNNDLKNRQVVTSAVVTCEPQLKKIPFHTELDIPVAYSIFLPTKDIESIQLAILLNERLAKWYIVENSWNRTVCEAILSHELGHVVCGHHKLYVNAVKDWIGHLDHPEEIKDLTLDDAVTFIKSAYGTIPVIDSETKELEADRYAIHSGYSAGLYLFFMISLYQIKYLKVQGKIDDTEAIESHILMRLAQVFKALGVCEQRVLSGKKLAQLEDTLREGVAISILSDIDLVNIVNSSDIIGFFLYFIASASQMAAAIDPGYGALDPFIRATLFDKVNKNKRAIQYSQLINLSFAEGWYVYEESLYQWQYLVENDKFDKIPKIILDGQKEDVLESSKKLFRVSKPFINEYL